MSEDTFTVTESSDGGSLTDSHWGDDDSPFRCEVCGTALEYSGRGRHPKFCDEHRKNKTSAGSSGSGSATGFKGKAQLEVALADLYRSVAFGVGIFDQFDAMTIAGSADSLAHSWIVLAETDPKVRKFLQKITTGTGWGAVILAHMMIAMPIMINHNALPQGLMDKMRPKAS
jgi:hypothetical protein